MAKGKNYLIKIHLEHIEDPLRMYSYKRLEKIRGYFCHLGMVYDNFMPYLKGFHLTLSQHLPKRDDDGWKLPDAQWLAHIQQNILEGNLTEAQGVVMLESMDINHGVQPPEWVKPVNRFWDCLKVLLEFMESDKPPEVVVCTTNSILLIYDYADALGSGFGSSLLIHGDLKYRIDT